MVLAPGPFPGEIFGDLIVLYELPKTHPKRRYFWCRDINTGKEGSVERGKLRGGYTKTGRLFYTKPYSECDSLEEYLRQIKWAKCPTYNRFRGTVNKKTRYRSNVIWEALYGEIPEGYEIDHIDQDTTNDDPSNLRAVTRAQNSLNKKPAKVYYDDPNIKRGKPYHIRPLRLKRYYFETEEEAKLGLNIFWKYHAPRELVLEHDLPGNVAGRFIPILNVV